DGAVGGGGEGSWGSRPSRLLKGDRPAGWVRPRGCSAVRGLMSRPRPSSAIRFVSRPPPTFPALPATNEADTKQHGRSRSGGGGAGGASQEVGRPSGSRVRRVAGLGGGPVPGRG
ncbi:unnamed protein product, partial [Laminaria digitata]